MRATRKWGPALIAGALLLSACGGEEGPQAIEPTETTDGDDDGDPPPPEPEDPFAIPDDPDDIDVTYAQAVVDELVPAADGPLRRALQTAPHPFPPDDLLRAIQATYSPDAAAPLVAAYAQLLGDEETAAERLANDAVSGWVVRDLHLARQDCIVLTFEFASGVGDDGGVAGVLLAGYGDRDPDGLNPTPWVIDQTNFVENQAPEDLEGRCDAEQDEDLDIPDDGEDQA